MAKLSVMNCILQIVLFSWKNSGDGYYTMSDFNKIKSLGGVTYNLFPQITYNNTIYSTLWYTESETNHILPFTIAKNESITKYFKVNRGTDGKLTECQSEELPEFVIMDEVTLKYNTDPVISIKAGSVVLTKGDYFRNDSSTDFLRVNGWYKEYALDIDNSLAKLIGILNNTVWFNTHVFEVDNTNINSLNIRNATTLKGDPFTFQLQTTSTGPWYFTYIEGEFFNEVYGNWRKATLDELSSLPNALSAVCYDKKDENNNIITIYAYTSETDEIKIKFDNAGEAVPHYECTATKDLVVTMVRDDFVVSENLTFRRVEYKPHVYVERPFTYVFRNLTVTNRSTLDVLESTIVVNGSFTVEEGATVKCKNLIIN